METSEEGIYSVSGITRRIKTLIRGNFAKVKVRGEIAKFTHYKASGHMYFTLADEDARLSGVMFQYANRRIDFQPGEGMDVVVEGRLDVYETRGNYQLIADNMFQEGRGELEREFNELKEKLEAEGALASDKKCPLPDLPAVIGVVTSGDGAAFWDIVQTISRRCPIVHIILYPSRVNGRDAGPEIAAAVRRLPQVAELDCMIVGRGGGSPEDLWGFNTEEVARAILDSPVPVISAVGHEVDVTIADLVADHRSPTPTAAGEEVAPALAEIKQRLSDTGARIKNGFRQLLDRRWERLRFMAEKTVFASPTGWQRPFREQLNTVKQQFNHNVMFYLNEQRSRLKSLKDRLGALNPEGVLNRGYAIVSKDEEIVGSAKKLAPDDRLKIKFSDGAAETLVSKVQLAESDD